MNLKLYGLPRSGTNYVAYLLEENLRGCRAWHNRTQWKHGPPVAVPYAYGYVLCVKDPYAWVVSMQRYEPGRPLTRLVDTWNSYGRAYLAFTDWNRLERRKIVHYDDALREPEGEVNRWRELTGEPFTQFVHAPGVHLRRGGDDMRGRAVLSDKRFESRREYYLARGYLNAYTPEALALMAQHLDEEVMQAFGYTVEVPEHAH